MSTADTEQKYVVFKAEDWPEHRYLPVDFPNPLAPDSFTVIRHGDVFAPAGLYAYANAIQTAIEIIKTEGGNAVQRFLPRMEELRDLIWERAQMAQAQSGKVPD